MIDQKVRLEIEFELTELQKITLQTPFAFDQNMRENARFESIIKMLTQKINGLFYAQLELELLKWFFYSFKEYEVVKPEETVTSTLYLR